MHESEKFFINPERQTPAQETEQDSEHFESRQDFLDEAMSEEETMLGEVLPQTKKTSSYLKRGIMGLMAAGALFAATEAGAQETWQKHYGYKGWKEHYGYGVKKEAPENYHLGAAIKAAELEERQKIQQIDQRYQQELHQIRLNIIDPIARETAIRRLEQKRTNEYLQAWVEKEVKGHAAKVKSGQYEEEK